MASGFLDVLLTATDLECDLRSLLDALAANDLDRSSCDLPDEGVSSPIIGAL